ncbi:MAG TPA: zinc ribbon domain-containing protein [Dehalococcoidia bacterium]|nr:zinc ribbon domain-containing protein [Dehalococcoidia bacterium]
MPTTTAGPGLGERAPDCELRRAWALPERLSALWQKQPLILAFLPESDEEYFNDNAAQLRDAHDTVTACGGAIVAITDQQTEDAERYATQWHIEFGLYGDRAGTAAAAFGVAPGMPASFVIDTAGVVRYAKRGTSETDYPPASVLIEALAHITGKQPPAPPVEAAAIAPERAAEALRVEGGGVTGGLYVCPKCRGMGYDVQEISTAGGIWSRLFNFQHRKFTAVTCRRCTYTELYKTSSSGLADVLDVLAGR